jgi:Uma2 family endonuclease
MAAVASSSIMTTEEMLALPEDGIDRELIRGELRERPMTKRNRWHSRSTIRLGYLLEEWLERQPEPRGEVVGGEAGFRLRRGPDTTVGIDLAYVSAEVVASTPEHAVFFEGPPILAVEILSPSDRHEEVSVKVRAYLDAGVALIWLVDPDFRTVRVHRPGAPPELFNELQELSGEPHLPGLRVPVARIFRI